MATANAAATLQRAADFAADFAGASLIIRAGTTALATHTVPSWTTSNSGSNALATAAAIADDTIDATGTADNAQLVDGTKIYSLTLGTSGSGPGGTDPDIVVSTTNYITGETSSVSSLVVTVPAA